MSYQVTERTKQIKENLYRQHSQKVEDVSQQVMWNGKACQVLTYHTDYQGNRQVVFETYITRVLDRQRGRYALRLNFRENRIVEMCRPNLETPNKPAERYLKVSLEGHPKPVHVFIPENIDSTRLQELNGRIFADQGQCVYTLKQDTRTGELFWLKEPKSAPTLTRQQPLAEPQTPRATHNAPSHRPKPTLTRQQPLAEPQTPRATQNAPGYIDVAQQCATMLTTGQNAKEIIKFINDFQGFLTKEDAQKLLILAVSHEYGQGIYNLFFDFVCAHSSTQELEEFQQYIQNQSEGIQATLRRNMVSLAQLIKSKQTHITPPSIQNEIGLMIRNPHADADMITQMLDHLYSTYPQTPEGKFTKTKDLLEFATQTIIANNKNERAIFTHLWNLLELDSAYTTRNPTTLNLILKKIDEWLILATHHNNTLIIQELETILRTLKELRPDFFRQG